MKKILPVFLALALGCGTASAQKAGVFNHFSLGVGLLGTDGQGVQLAAPIGSHLQLRAGYTTHALLFAAMDASLKSTEIGSINPYRQVIEVGLDEGDFRVDALDLEAQFRSDNLQLLLDIFPFKKAGFHLSVGSYFSLAGQGLLQASAKPLRDDGESVFPGNPWDTEILGLSFNPDGRLCLDLQWKNKVVRPYVGIGFGRPVSLKHRVGVNLDLGVAYTGGINLVSYSWYDDQEHPKTVTLDANFIDENILSDKELDDDIRETFDEVKKYLDYTKYAALYPVLKFSIFIRLF